MSYPVTPPSHFPPAWLGRLLGRVVEARPHEIKAMLCGFAWFFCLLSGYYLLRPLRDAMGLVGGAGHLQWLFTATFFSMLALVPVFGAVASRWAPRRFVPLIYRFFALNILGFGWLFALGSQSVLLAGIFFVWISVFNLFAVSIFWSVLADHFNSEQGRRLFGFIAAGGTAGALLGPALAALLAVKAGIAVLAVLSAVLLEAAVHCFLGLDRNAPRNAHGEHGGKERADSRIAGGIFAGIQLILRDRYLLAIVAYLLLHSLASTFLYFEQGRLVASTLHDTATRTRLFAITDFAVSCITLLLQLFVTGRFLRRFGVVAALLLLRLASLFAYGAIALWPLLAVLVAAQSLRRALDYAVARPGREVLFTVVSREAKYKARNVIETVVFRGGDAATGWLFAGLAAAGIGFGAMAIASLPLVAGWSALALWLARAQERKAGLAMNGPPEETMPTAPGPRGSGDQQENAMSQTDRPHSPDLHEAGGMSRKDFLRLAVATVAGTTFGANAQSPAGSASASAAGGAVGGTVGGGAPAGKMHTRAIPSSGERLGIIGCGTWQTFDVGSTPAERDPLADVLRILFAAGGSVIDSSPMYGRSEAVAGDLLTALQLHERAFVATKVWTTGREAGIKQMHESMALLQQPRINLMQIHNLVDWRTHLKTLRAWKDEARIRYLGITHYTASAFDQLASILRTEKLDFVQMNYSLDDRDAEARLLPLAADRGVAVLVNQPFGGGSLLRKLARAPLPQWAGEIGCGSWAQILLKYVVSHPAVTCAIPGTGKPRHMTDNCRAGVGILPDAAMRKKMVATWQTL